MDDLRYDPEAAELLRALRRAYVNSLLAGDEVAAELVIAEAIEAGLAEPLIGEQIITPALRQVGEMWASGRLSVAEEHLATEISLRVLALQRERFRAVARRGQQRIMLAAVQGERHVVGLELAANLLTHAGYEVRFLGADVPTDSLSRIVERHWPSVFGFTCTMPEAAALLDLTIEEVRRTSPSIGVIVGGVGVPEFLRESDWLAVARSAAEAVTKVDTLVHRPSLN